MNDDIKADVLMLLGISTPTDTQDSIISFLVEDTIEAVRAYCRIELVPDKLATLIAQMVARQYRENGYGSEEVPTDVKSVSEGARSVSFETRSLAGMLNDYRARLKPYVNRKGRVPSDII
ncbi:MAG: hypothetical protein Q4G33_09855 [bacterium]|nr:hypothetical protein [bacterium]